MKVMFISRISRFTLLTSLQKWPVPTRTCVDPSAIAASRSADIPIESVSSGNPRRDATLEAFPQAAKLLPLLRRIVRGRRNAHDSAHADARQVGDGQRKRQDLVGSDAAFRRLLR
jgi:hypothetical protein